jgi:hypothetical protein
MLKLNRTGSHCSGYDQHLKYWPIKEMVAGNSVTDLAIYWKQA